MTFFNLIAKLGLDSSSFDAGMKRAESSASKLGGVLKSRLAGAFSIGAAVAITKQALNDAGRIVDLADAYNMTTKQVQILMEAAAENGVELENLTQITVKLLEARQRAMKGDEGAINAFARMGVSVKRLNDEQLSNFDLLKEIGSASSARNDSLQSQADLLELVGNKSAKAAEAIRQLHNTEPLIIVPDDQLRKLDKIGDKFTQIWNTAKSLGMILVVQSVEDVGKTWDSFDEMMSKAFGIKPMSASRRPEDNTDYAALNAGGYQASVDAIEANRDVEKRKGSKIERMRSEKSKFSRAEGGSLAGMGGLFLGADYSLRLMDVQKKQADILTKIEANTSKTATALDPNQ